MRIVIAGGGTGGHVVPALAIAGAIQEIHPADITFVGTARGLETRLVPQAGYRLELIRVGQLNRVSLTTRLKTLLGLPGSLLECFRLLGRYRPQIAIGVGGYASGPVILAATIRRIPTLIFEPNAAPGMANRLIGRWVSGAAINFASTRSYLRHAEITGVPVRQEFFHLGAESPVHPPCLLVFGGSQGASVFNRRMPEIVKDLLDRVPGLRVVHQAGARNAEATEEAYRSSGAPQGRWKVVPYLDDMPVQFERASLILARSGASTVAELAAAGKPSLLVPFPRAADDHQRKNAEALADAGAARVLLEEKMTEDFLLRELCELLANPTLLAEMGARAHGLAHPNAARHIAQMALSLAAQSRSELAPEG